MLLLSITNGTPGAKTLPAGFTTLYSGVAGAIGYRVMQPEDTSFTLYTDLYATMVSIRGSAASPSVDAVSSAALTTSSGAIATPTVMPTRDGDIAFMIFTSSYRFFVSPAPGYTNLITYNLNGPSGCGMALAWTQLAAAATFSGTSTGAQAEPLYPAVAMTVLLK